MLAVKYHTMNIVFTNYEPKNIHSFFRFSDMTKSLLSSSTTAESEAWHT